MTISLFEILGLGQLTQMPRVGGRRTFRYIPFHDVHDWADVGWYWDGTFRGSPYPNTIIIEWLCSCPLVEPKGSTHDDKN